MAGDTLSYAQASIPSPNPQLLPKKVAFEDHADHMTGKSTVDEHRASAIYRLSLNRGFSKKDSVTDWSGASMKVIPGNDRAVSAERCATLLESSPNDVMLLDVRPYAHFAKGNIKGSLNLCIPTTLLKRPSFDTQKLANTFTNEADKQNFARWNHCRYIIVYDAGTYDMKDAGPLANVLNKFTAEGWNGDALILQGGFGLFSNRFPALVQQQHSPVKSSKKPIPMHIDLPSAAPIAGGCALPDASRPTIPFFGNIRQHMDLLGGVGQIPLQLPDNLTESKKQSLPPWLREATDPADHGRSVSDNFLDLEKKELERMKQALTYDKAADNSTGVFPGKFRVAGIEKGTKNRYNDIYPFDHSRVKLQDVPPGECDYVNASYMKAEYSNIRYIATQAPIPDTFNVSLINSTATSYFLNASHRQSLALLVLI
jgi:protein-tyrosine phosphatase